MLPDRLVLALGAVSTVAILAGAATTIVYLRADTLQHAETRFADLALVLAEQTARAVQQVDGILDSVDEDVLRIAREGGPRALAGREMHRQLARHRGTAPQILVLGLLDANGDMLAVSDRFPAPAINNADREHFIAHRAGRSAGLYVGAPLVGRATARWTIPLSRTVRDPGGAFLGVIAGATNLGYFERLHGELNLGENGTLRLYRDDGTTLTAHPEDATPAAGAPAAERDAVVAAATASPSGILRLASPVPAVVAFRRLDAYPMIVTVGAPERELLAPWHLPAWTLGGLGIGAAVFVLGFAVQLARRLRAERALRDEVAAAESRWRQALEGADHGVFDWNFAKGTFYRSPRYLQMLGVAEGETPPEAPREHWVHPDDRERVRRVREDSTAGRTNQFYDRFRILRPDGSVLPVLMRGVVIDHLSDGRAARIVGTLTDLSALEVARDRLAESEARLNGIVQSALDAILTIDADQRIVLFNNAAERLFGRTAAESIGAPLDQLIPERFRAAHRAAVARFAASGETSRRMGDGMPLAALRADGTEFPVEGSISRVNVDGRTLLTVILRDITERRQAEQEIARSHAELRALAAGMHEVREAERTRIARELHDELGQALTALKMDLEALEARIPLGQGELFERTAAMRSLLDFTFATTRRLSADLRPLVLDDLGLGAAVEWLVQSVCQRAQFACDLKIDPPLGDLGEPHATVLFRVLQESLTNVTRHAGARRVEIRLARQGDRAVLTVRDDGRGIDAAAEAKPGSFGLRGLRERVLVLGGEVEVSGRRGEGTTVRASVPLPRGGNEDREAA